MATGNPPITSRSVMPARPGPTAQAATNITRPRCTPRTVASAKTATKISIAATGANEGDIRAWRQAARGQSYAASGHLLRPRG